MEFSNNTEYVSDIKLQIFKWRFKETVGLFCYTATELLKPFKRLCKYLEMYENI